MVWLYKATGTIGYWGWNRQAVSHLCHTLIGEECVRCLAWLRNMKGGWKVGDWDSVL